MSSMSPLDPYPVTLSSGLRLEVASQGRGPAILFLHGFPDSWRSYAPVIAHLPHDVQALAVTQRGHGDSEHPASAYRMEDFAADALALMDAAGIEQATVVGHSMGSLVAQELALARPDRVAGLVLIGAATSFDTPPIRAFEETVRQFGDAIPYELAWDFQVSTLHRQVPEAFLNTLVSESMKVPARVWRDALAGILAFRSADRLGGLTMPTLIVWGDRDEMAPSLEQERLRRGIRDATLRVYEDTGHSAHWEHPARFADDLLSFVQARAASLRTAI